MPDDGPADTAPKHARHDSWPLHLQAAFLRALSATHSVSEAAKSVGNPASGRLGPAAERHARDFEALLARVERGEAVATGALSPDDPGEFDGVMRANTGPSPCPSGMSDAELMKALQENGWKA